MKKIFLFTFFVFLLFSLAFGQLNITKVYECTLEIKNISLNPGDNYSFDVYIKRNTSNWLKLGHLNFMGEKYYSNLVFNYNSNALENPEISNLSPIASGIELNINNQDILSIDLLDGGDEVPTSETKLLTVDFEITNPYAMSQLNWKNNDTVIVDESSNQYVYFNGCLELLGSGNIYLPINYENIENSEDENFLKIHPNPLGTYSPQTKFSLTAPETGKVILNLYNVKGQYISKLYEGYHQKNDVIQRTWDGNTKKNKNLTSGVYLFQLLLNNNIYDTDKILFVR